MSPAEIFLMVWAVIATIIAIGFYTIARHLRLAVIILNFGIQMIGEGKAKLVPNGGGFKIEEV